MCLDIAAALAMCIPGRILTEMAATNLLRPNQQMTMPPGVLGGPQLHAPAFSQTLPGLQRLTQQTEEPSGTFPVTMAFLRLTSALLSGGLSASNLQVALSSFLIIHIPSFVVTAALARLPCSLHSDCMARL